jgi:hypothetical protein
MLADEAESLLIVFTGFCFDPPARRAPPCGERPRRAAEVIQESDGLGAVKHCRLLCMVKAYFPMADLHTNNQYAVGYQTIQFSSSRMGSYC